MSRWVCALVLLLLVYAWYSCSDTRKLNTLTVRPEYRCSSYDRSDYYYPQSVEPLIAKRDGRVSRYTGYRFSSLNEGHIEHVVALSEAHDSGMCGASYARREQFAQDLDNLVLALPSVNRRKYNKDAAGWSPRRNKCWFARTIIRVKTKYKLSVDAREKAALRKLLDTC